MNGGSHGSGRVLIGNWFRKLPSEFYEWRSQAERVSQSLLDARLAVAGSVSRVMPIDNPLTRVSKQFNLPVSAGRSSHAWNYAISGRFQASRKRERASEWAVREARRKNGTNQRRSNRCIGVPRSDGLWLSFRFLSCVFLPIKIAPTKHTE